MHQGTRDPNMPLLPAAVDRIFAERVSRLRQKSCSFVRKKTMAKAPTQIPTASADVAAAAAELVKLQEETKASYKRIDELEGTILEAIKASKKAGKLLLPNGGVLTCKDNFAGRNVAFKTTAIRRYEVVVA